MLNKAVCKYYRTRKREFFWDTENHACSGL